MSVKVGHLFYWSASEDMVNIMTALGIILTVGGKYLMSFDRPNHLIQGVLYMNRLRIMQ